MPSRAAKARYQKSPHGKEKRRAMAKTLKGKAGNRRRRLRAEYGIEVEQYDEMLKSQNYCCAICHAEEWTQRYGKLVVDHDHETHAVRGLLCDACNIGLGKFKDTIALMKAAVSYLEKFGG